MICKFCNAATVDNAKFCSECGMPLSDGGAVSTARVHHKGKTLVVAAFVALLLLVFVSLFIANYFGNSSSSKLKGTWQRDDTVTTGAEVTSYTFNSNDGEAHYSQDLAADMTDTLAFDWFVTDDNELVLLWSNTSCTKYSWNPSIGNYVLSSNEYSWYIKSNTLYISSSSAENGYYIYRKQGI